jgi:TP901 family phage tail tape measure protein
MAANVVEIVVKASDQTQAGFGAAKAEAAASADEIAAAQDRVAESEMKLRDAQMQQADAQMRLEELQQSGTASADEIAAAQDKVTAATLRAADAQIRLGEANETLAGKEALAGDAGEVQAEKTGLASRMSGVAGAGLAKFGMLGSMALAGIGVESVKMAMSFQQSMERLVTQAGVPQKELGSLKSGILGLAGAVGFSPESLSESLYHVASNMASLGATAPQMLGAVKIAAEGAKVGGANLEDVTNALTAAIASGIPGVQNYSQAMGALNAIVGAGDMKMQDLSEAMGSGLMAVVKGYGLSLKDVGAALDVFGDNNIRGSHAATDLRMAVQALAVPAAAGKAELAGMGLSMTSLATTMREHGLLAALEELQGRFKSAGITASEQGQVITEIFGKKAGVGLAVLMDQMDRLKSKYPDITAGADNFGKAWGATQQTTGQQLDELRATFESLGVAIGTKLLPVISAFAGFLDRNRAVLQALAPIILAIVAAMTAWAGIMKIIDILSDLNPWTIAIMAVIAAVVLLVEHWKTIEKVAKEVFKAVTGAVSTAFDWIKGHWPLLLAILTGPVGLATLFIIKHWAQLREDTAAAFDFLRHAIASKLDQVRHDMASWGDDVINWFKALPGRILRALGDLSHLLWNAGVSILDGLLHGMASKFDEVRHTVASWGHDISGAFSSALKIFSPSQVFAQHGQMIVEGLTRGITAAVPRVIQAVTAMGRSLMDAGKAAVTGLVAGMRSMMGELTEVVQELAAEADAAIRARMEISSPSRVTYRHGQAIAAGLAAGILSGKSAVATSARQLAGSAGTGASGGGGAAAGGPLTIVFQPGGGSGLEAQFWAWLRTGVRAQGGDPRIFNKKVRFL